MRFRYSYNTKDNVRHDAEIDASCREDVFTTLKAQGIKPYAVSLAPGLLNRIRAYKSQVLAALALVIMSATVGVMVLREGSTAGDEIRRPDETTPLNRTQLHGDRMMIEQGVRTGWFMVFSNLCEQLLAAYAQPGRPVARRKEWGGGEISDANFREALKVRTVFLPDDAEEVRMLKRIVEGMKDEMRTFLSDGGSVASYLSLLDERQRLEQRYFQENAEELQKEIAGCSSDRIYTKWMRRNADLRARGLMMIPMPDALRNEGEVPNE